ARRGFRLAGHCASTPPPSSSPCRPWPVLRELCPLCASLGRLLAPSCHPVGTRCLKLFLFPEQGLSRLHHRSLWVANAIGEQFLRILHQILSIDDRGAVLAALVAVQPDRDVVGGRDLVATELVARDLRDIEAHLRCRRRSNIEGEYQSRRGEHKLLHDDILHGSSSAEFCERSVLGICRIRD